MVLRNTAKKLGTNDSALKVKRKTGKTNWKLTFCDDFTFVSSCLLAAEIDSLLLQINGKRLYLNATRHRQNVYYPLIQNHGQSLLYCNVGFCLRNHRVAETSPVENSKRFGDRRETPMER